MSARDGGKLSKATSVEGMAAEALAATHAAQRTRNLILGPLLLVGGLIIGVLAYWLVTHRQMYYGGFGFLSAFSALSTGFYKTRRGLESL